MSDSKLDLRAAFKGHPNLLDYLDEIERIGKAFEGEIKTSSNLGGDEGLCHYMNSLIRFHLSVGRANENLGISPTEADCKAMLIKHWNLQKRNRSISLGEKRAIATRIAYADGLRLDASGEHDTPIEVAMLVSAHIEVIDPSKTLSENGVLRHYAVSIEAIKKSISRFRSSIKGANVFWLNEETFQFEYALAEIKLLNGLPNRTGRPRKKSN